MRIRKICNKKKTFTKMCNVQYEPCQNFYRTDTSNLRVKMETL